MDTLQHRQARELHRRIQARARRTQILRRRVALAAASLFVASWGTIYVGGQFGHLTSGQLALAAAKSQSSSSDSLSSNATAVVSPTAVITAQS